MLRPAHSPSTWLVILLAAAILLTGCASPASPLSVGAVPSAPPAASSTPAQPAAAPGESTATAVPFQTSTPPPPVTPTTLPLATPDLEAFKDLAYRIPDLAQTFPETGGVFQLSGGVFDQPIPNSSASLHVELLDGASGDLNGDGLSDGAVVLLVESGGSGSFRYLATVVSQNGELVNTATAFLGDRTQVDGIAIDGAAVRLALTTHAPEDPLCCPTQQANAVYLLNGNILAPRGMAGAASQALQGVQALRDQDMDALAALAHPTHGIRFSPYAFVRQEDLVFTPEQVSKLMDDPTVYNWGVFDGSGEPIQMAFPEYYQRFIYSRDFATPDQVSFNQRTGMGNSIDNSQEFYPGAVVVEFYISPKDPQYGGMDWQSLRLVMQNEGGMWYVVGVIHDEWTI